MRDGWEIKKLGDVCVIERGGSPRPIQSYLTDDANGLNWIKIGDAVEGSKYIVSTKEKIIPEGLKKTRFVHKGDFLLSNSMSFGRPYILAIDGCIHDGWLVVHDTNNCFDKSFLYYYLSSKSIYAEFKRLAVGGVVNNLNSELVRNVNVSIPPLSEQERIVAELDCLSSIIEKQKQQLKEYDTLAQSIFYDMFGDPITNEKGWEVKKWSMLFDTILGKMLDKKKQIETDEALPYLGNTNVQWGYFDLQDLKTMTFSKKEREKLRLKLGDILICEGGDAGRCAVWSGSSDEILFQKAIHRARRKRDDEIVPCYVSFLLQEIKANGGLKNYISKSTIEHLTGEKLNILPIMLPPYTLQQEFASKIEAIEKQKELIKQSIAETETLFNSRMDYYFN